MPSPNHAKLQLPEHEVDSSSDGQREPTARDFRYHDAIDGRSFIRKDYLLALQPLSSVPRSDHLPNSDMPNIEFSCRPESADHATVPRMMFLLNRLRPGGQLQRFVRFLLFMQSLFSLEPFLLPLIATLLQQAEICANFESIDIVCSLRYCRI